VDQVTLNCFAAVNKRLDKIMALLEEIKANTAPINHYDPLSMRGKVIYVLGEEECNEQRRNP